MAKRSDLTQIAHLCGQCRVLEAALRSLSEGGRIVQLVVSYGPVGLRMEGEAPHDFGTPVSTIDIDFPPQLVEGIKDLLRQKFSAADQTLRQMGMDP